MAARRCSGCDLWMPNDRQLCPVCGQETWESRFDEWPADWKDQADLLKKRVVPGKLIPNIDVKLHKAGKHHFIDVETPKKSGYLDIEAGSILKVRGRFFEVVGPYRDLGWMLEVIKLVMDENEIEVLSEAKYKTLETKRGIRS